MLDAVDEPKASGPCEGPGHACHSSAHCGRCDTAPAVALGRDARFKEIVRVLNERRICAMPVVSGEGRLVGVVAESDLAAQGGVPGP
ncbi:CBS domain-containing protein [Streptomyces sp. NPDC048231]|uniref:CBS domain-containing protein n=1 Tax=unclassified Streptomyces TaxID=2593676 RepID=UPI0036C2A2F3